MAHLDQKLAETILDALYDVGLMGNDYKLPKPDCRLLPNWVVCRYPPLKVAKVREWATVLRARIEASDLAWHDNEPYKQIGRWHPVSINLRLPLQGWEDIVGWPHPYADIGIDFYWEVVKRREVTEPIFMFQRIKNEDQIQLLERRAREIIDDHLRAVASETINQPAVGGEATGALASSEVPSSILILKPRPKV